MTRVYFGIAIGVMLAWWIGSPPDGFAVGCFLGLAAVLWLYERCESRPGASK